MLQPGYYLKWLWWTETCLTVPDVPAQRAKLAPVLHHGMEQGHAEQQAPPLRGLGTLMQVGFAEACVRAKHVGLQTLQARKRTLKVARAVSSMKSRARRHMFQQQTGGGWTADMLSVCSAGVCTAEPTPAALCLDDVGQIEQC